MEPQKKPYNDPIHVTKANVKAMKAAGMEPTGYTKPCDVPTCTVCKKVKGTKSPWNVKW